MDYTINHFDFLKQGINLAEATVFSTAQIDKMIFSTTDFQKNLSRPLGYLWKKCFAPFHLYTGILLLMMLYFAFRLPLAFEEGVSFGLFIRRSFFVAITQYPDPTNHVLYSLLANLIWMGLGFTKSTLVIRLVAILFSAMAFNFIMNQTKSILLQSFSALAILSQFEFISYSFQARSYSMQILFASMIMLLCLRSNNFSRNKLIPSLVILSTLGLYASPSFIFTLVPVYIWLIMYSRLDWKLLLYSILSIVILTSICYAPAMLIDGIKNILFTEQTDFFARNSTPLVSIQNYLIDYFNIPFLLLLLPSIYVLYNNRNFKFLNSISIFILTPIIMMLIFQQHPPIKVFLPVIFCIIIVLTELSETIIPEKLTSIPIQKIKPLLFLLISAIIILAFWAFDKFYFKGDLESSYALKNAKLYKLSPDNLYLDKNSGNYLSRTIRVNSWLKGIKIIEVENVDSLPINCYLISNRKEIYQTDSTIKPIIDSLKVGKDEIYLFK